MVHSTNILQKRIFVKGFLQKILNFFLFQENGNFQAFETPDRVCIKTGDFGKLFLFCIDVEMNMYICYNVS